MTDDVKLLAEIRARHEYAESGRDTPRGMALCGPVQAQLHADRATLLRLLDELEADFNERLGRVMEPHLAREARLREENTELRIEYAQLHDLAVKCLAGTRLPLMDFLGITERAALAAEVKR